MYLIFLHDVAITSNFVAQQPTKGQYMLAVCWTYEYMLKDIENDYLLASHGSSR